MRRPTPLLALVIASVLAGCSLPLAEAPTPFPTRVEPSPTATEVAAAIPGEAPDPEAINPQNLGALYAVGGFPHDLTGALDWSPDSKLLALATIHGSGIFDVQRLLKLRPLLSDVTPTSLAFSPDGTRVVTGGKDIPESPRDTVTIWQVSDGAKLQTMIGHTEWVNAVDYSPTGEFVASGSDDSTVRLWQVEEGTEAMVLRGHTGPVTSVAFSPDGRVLASGSLDGTVRLWRVDDGEQLRELAQGELGVTSLAFSPEGITLAAGSADGTIRLFTAGTGATLGRLTGNEQAVTDLDFSPDGSLLVSSGRDNSLRFWELSGGTQVRVLAAHDEPVMGVGFAPNGRYLASGSLDGSVKIWGIGEPLAAAPTPDPVADPIEHLAAGTELQLSELHMFSEDQGWAIGGAAGEATHVFRTEDGGSNWLEVTPRQSVQPIEAFRQAATGAFHDPYTGWIVYFPLDYLSGPSELEVIRTWRTSDGGATWVEDRPQAAMDLNEGPPLVAFADDQFGWMLAEFVVGLGQHGYALLRTIDSGFEWQTLHQPPDTLSACHKTGIAFADAGNGWITEDCPPELANAAVLSSADGGETFSTIALPGPAADPTFLDGGNCLPHSPQLFAAGQGLLAVECAGSAGGYLYRTEDGGESWTTLSYPGGSLQFIDERVGWALSRRIYKTVDGGTTWVLIKIIDWRGSFSFVDAELGWAIASGNGAVELVRTTDGAQRWAILEPVVAP